MQKVSAHILETTINSNMNFHFEMSTYSAAQFIGKMLHNLTEQS